jgi:3-methyladenine DNA glycosylase AlkD
MKKLIPAQIALRKHATKANKKTNEWFFKTGPGQYGHGDEFIGVKVPKTRLVAKAFADLSLTEIKILLDSPVHEDRLLGVILLRIQYEKAVKKNDLKIQKTIFNFYLKNKSRVNNWDLVDSSAPYLTGHFIFHTPNAQKKIFSLIHSKNMWDRRIAILSTFYFIRQYHFNPTIELARILLKDEEDLMHKASGWMLREMGKKDVEELIKFLDQYSSQMPRTMLRYAIEKFPEKIRLSYLKKPNTLPSK